MEEQGFQPNDKVLVYNKDQMLYPAEVVFFERFFTRYSENFAHQILKNEGKSRYYIHYTGWDDKYEL